MKSSTLAAWWRFDEGRGKTAREHVSGTENAIRYVFNNAKYKPSSDPMWRAGIDGQALLFDGYSTWVTHPAEAFRTPKRAMTIVAWVAPRTFEAGLGGQLSAVVNQHNRLADQGFILGTSTHGEWSLQIGTGAAWIEVWSKDVRLPRHTWAHLAAVFDSNHGRLTLYIDGERVAKHAFKPGLEIQPAAKDVLIGRHNEPARLGAFEANLFDGLIGGLKIDAAVWSSAQVKAEYTAGIQPHGGQKPPADTRPRRSRYDGDKHRPQFHFIPPQHWMNEPHAILHFAGKYHVMYQHNAHGPFWHNISWGHAISDDLVHWKDLPDAIVPEKDAVAPDGIWSGSASVDADGNPVLFFTAGNNATHPNQSTGLARSTFLQDGDSDLVRWTLESALVTTLDQNIEIQGHKVMPTEFRDPFVWREGDLWYQLVGAGVQDVGGTALLYTSVDLVHWTYRKPFLVGDRKRFPITSMMWELPVFLPVGRGKHVFLFSPWWAPGVLSADFLKYVPYWVGTWDATTLTFTPDFEKPRIFDYGQHFTGPSGTVDAYGRSIVFNIAQTKRDSQMSYDLGWDGNAGLPVELFLHDDGELGVRPVAELDTLRGQHLIGMANVTSGEANQYLAQVSGAMLEIELTVRVPDGQQCIVAVRRSPGREEETQLFYDSRDETFGIDRERSSLTASVHQRGVQSGPLALAGAELRLKVYIDHSMIAAYANGRNSVTSRVYPSRDDATGVALSGGNSLLIERLDVWEMCSAYN